MSQIAISFRDEPTVLKKNAFILLDWLQGVNFSTRWRKSYNLSRHAWGEGDLRFQLGWTDKRLQPAIEELKAAELIEHGDAGWKLTSSGHDYPCEDFITD
jgi:hypothetical protein